MQHGSTRLHLRPVLRSSITLTVLIGVFLSCVLLASHYLDRQFEQAHWQAEQIETVSSITAEITGYFQQALSDLLLIASDKSKFANTSQSNAELIDHFSRLATISRSYYQLRFLDLSGQEIARVNFDGTKPTVVRGEELQDKSTRPYFQQSIGLNAGEVYVSRFDLNIEHQSIELPIRPVVRIATPVFNPAGEKTGIVIFNFLGDKLLGPLTFHDQNNDSKLYLVNHEGYYLYSDQPEQNWGFMYPGRPSFAQQFSEWEALSAKMSGQLVSNTGLFTFSTVNRLENIYQLSLHSFKAAHHVKLALDEPPWRIVSYVPEQTLYAATERRFNYGILVVTLLLLAAFPITYAWANSREKLKALGELQRLYAQAMEQNSDLIYITDANGLILHANKATQECTGYSESEIVGQHPSLFKSGMQSEAMYENLWKTVKSGSTFKGLFINKRKDGEMFYELKTITPMLDEHGEITHFVSTGVDVSKLQESRLKEMVLASNLASGISHHFGNMLCGILGYISLAEVPGIHSGVRAQHIHNARLATEKATKLLEEIRTSAGDSALSHQPLDISRLLKRIIAEDKKHQTPTIEFITNISSETPNILGNQQYLKKAIEALLKNAREAVGQLGTIKLTAALSEHTHQHCSCCDYPLDGEFVEISVSDNGAGIAPENMQFIWDPFYSTKESRLLVGETPGLGLTKVRSIVHNHNGHIIVDTDNEHYTTIRLLFPPAPHLVETLQTEPGEKETEAFPA
ncbi:MAG: PAS domain S-box protein [Gammaproteobacteria bacterium]|nr:PAS domain S-box protein [Gammaproteobacteria bacterium]